jgi:hypothetical protein
MDVRQRDGYQLHLTHIGAMSRTQHLDLSLFQATAPRSRFHDGKGIYKTTNFYKILIVSAFTHLPRLASLDKIVKVDTIRIL